MVEKQKGLFKLDVVMAHSKAVQDREYFSPNKHLEFSIVVENSLSTTSHEITLNNETNS